MTLNVAEGLPSPSWRGIPFPLTSLENGFTHDHVEHKFPFVDGMHIEATGRNGFNFQARIPFNNAVVAAGFEPWAGQELYPMLFKRFLAACLDRSSGEFKHPDFGPIQCKARDVNWRYTGTAPRDGTELTVRFYQSDDDIDQLASQLTNNSPMASALANAEVLDGEIANAGPLPELGNDTSTFSGMMKDYQAGTGNLGRVNSKLENTDAALTRMDNVSFWPLRSATEDMRSAIIDLSSFSNTGGKPVKTFVVPLGSSLPAIAIRLNVRTDDLVRMNPNLARDPHVPAGTRLRFTL